MTLPKRLPLNPSKWRDRVPTMPRPDVCPTCQFTTFRVVHYPARDLSVWKCTTCHREFGPDQDRNRITD